MQNIQRSLVDRRSLNGLQVIRLHYNTADDIQKYMTVIRESIKVIEIGLTHTKILLKVLHTFKVIDLKYIYGQKKFLAI